MRLPLKKIRVVLFLSLIMAVGIFATKPKQEKEEYTNLHILSKDLTEHEMDIIMHRFNSELGVTCIYCHVTRKNAPYPEPMDFASDEKAEKIQAREMLKMTMKINEKYFHKKLNNKLTVRPAIWCGTCHRGLLIQPKLKKL